MATNQDVKIRITGDATGFGAAVAQAKSGVTSLQSMAKGLGAAYFATTAAVTGAVLALRRITEGVEALKDLSEATGSSVENISALEDVAKRTGTSFDAVGAALIKFNKALNDAQDPTSDAGIIFKQLGLNAKELAQLDPSVGLLKTAQALDTFAEGGGKARAELLLLSKSTRELAPFLKDLAQAGELHATVTAQQAANAEEFNNNLHALEKSSLDFARSLSSQVIPVLNTMFAEVKAAGGVWEAYKGALTRGLGQVEIDKTQDQITSLRGEIDELQKRIVQGEAAGASAFARLYGKQASEQIHETTKALVSLQEQERRLQAERYAALGAGKSTAGAGRGSIVPEAVKPKFNADAIEAAKRAAAEEKKRREEAIAAEKRRLDAYSHLTQSITERQAAEDAELASTGKLTEAEKFRTKVIADLENGYLKLTAAETVDTYERLNNLVATEKLRLENEEWIKQIQEAQKALTQANEKNIAEQQKNVEAAQDQSVVAQRMLDEYGMTAEAVEKVAIAHELNRAATLREYATMLDLVGAAGGELYRNEAAAIDKTADSLTKLSAKRKFDREDPGSGAKRAVDDYIQEVNDAGTAMEKVVGGGLRSLEDGLTDLFTKGKFDAKSFIDALISEFVRLQVVKPLLANIFGGGGGGGFGGLASLFGGGGGLAGAGGGAGNYNYGGGFALGGAFDRSGLHAFAKGDIFTSPTMFKFAAGGAFRHGVMGEAGPEAVMPLTRGGDGSLGVSAPGGWGGGGGVSIVQNNSFGAGVSPSQLALALEQNRRQTQAEISDQMRRGSRAYN